MDIRRIRTIVFSPTRTSLHIAQAIAAGIGNTFEAACEISDLTYADARDCIATPETVAVVAVPVYGGHLPRIAAERLQGIEGAGTPAVAVAVYGNRDYGNAVRELAKLLSECGFVTVAVAAFVGEHSYSTASAPIAAGRPDGRDLEYAERFGARVAEKLKAGVGPEPVDPSRLPRVYNPPAAILSLAGFVAGSRLRRRLGIYSTSPAGPVTDPELCTGCGACVGRCPAGAVAAGDEIRTDYSRCIGCCACVKNCPSGARTYAPPIARVLSRRFSSRKEPITLL